LKRIGIALFSTLPVFRSAWHFATAGAIVEAAETFINFSFVRTRMHRKEGQNGFGRIDEYKKIKRFLIGNYRCV
jgi:hypothetical protein